MNLNDFSRKVELLGANVDTGGGHVAIRSVSRAYGFGRPPGGFQENNPVNLAAFSAMEALPALDHTTLQINGDARLSAQGRSERLKPASVEAIKTIATAGRDIAAHGVKLAAREAELYQPAAVDAPTESRHREMRDDWRNMSTSRRTTALNAIRDGKAPDLLAALKRAPSTLLQDHERSIVESAWRADVERREPKKAAELQSARANHEWAESVVKAAAQYSPRSTGLSPVEISEGVSGTGGEWVFSSTSADAAA